MACHVRPTTQRVAVPIVAQGYDSILPMPPDLVVSTGRHFVGRYVSDSTAKNITASEYQSYRRAGLSVILFAENTNLDWLMSMSEAESFGTRCRRFANEAGFPSDRPLFASIDTEIFSNQFAQACAYILNFAKGAGGPPAGYLQNDLGRYCMTRGVVYVCNTAAIDDGQPTSAQLLQCHEFPGGPLVGFDAPLGNTGILVDYDFATREDYGQAPAPSDPIQQETDMFLIEEKGANGPIYLCAGLTKHALSNEQVAAYEAMGLTRKQLSGAQLASIPTA